MSMSAAPVSMLASEPLLDDSVATTSTIWSVEVDSADANAWSQMLDLFDDANVYQTAAYGAIHWGEANLSRLILKRNGEVVSIAQLRIVRPMNMPFGIAYLRWGPLWQRRDSEMDPETPSRMVRAIEDEYLNRRRLLVRVIPNAFPGTKRAELMANAFASFKSEPSDSSNTYRTLVLDLAPTLEDLRKNFDKKWRNQLTRAEKNDLAVISGTTDELYRTFCRMYHDMRGRKSFETTVDVEEFGRMQHSLPESQRMRVLICTDKGVPAAGVVVSAQGDSAIYLLGATSAEGLNSKGAYLLHWTVIQWLKGIGVRWYDLGGIDPKHNPGVYHFKKGFSGADVCQMAPLVASRSMMSSVFVKSGFAVQGAVRQLSNLKSRLARHSRSADGAAQ